MSSKTRTKKFARNEVTGELKRPTHKETYAAKLETIRRKEVRNLKKSFDQNRKGEH